MPVYESKCQTCDCKHEYVRTVSTRNDTPICCGAPTHKRILSAPAGIMDIPAYESPASGKWITSRAERREDFKRTGCREWEGRASEQKQADKNVAEAEKKADAALDHTVRTAWAALPPSTKAAALASAT